MAGLYPDIPAPRMPYDLDATAGFYASSDGTAVAAFTQPQLAKLNTETAGDALPGVLSASQYFVGLIFPQARDVVAFTIAGTVTQSRDFQVSIDTTNGYDGTWTTVDAGFFAVGSVGTYLRTGIQNLSVPATGVKAVRLGQASGVDVLHMYGSITDTTADVLRFWDPVSDVPLSASRPAFDYGEVARGSSGSSTFRIKNNSSTFTANTVSVALSAPTDETPSLIGQFMLNSGGGPVTVVSLGNLAPGTTSPVITFLRNTSSTAQLGLGTGRITATAASWS